MTLFQWVMLVVTCAALMWALAAFDRLIDLGSAESGGRQAGDRLVGASEIRGVQESSFQKGLGRNRLFVKWLFLTPGWAGEFRIARSLFRRFRIGSAIAFMGFVSFGAGVFLHL